MENLNSIKGTLADAGKTGVWACWVIRKGSRNHIKMVYEHYATQSSNISKDFRIAKINIRELLVNQYF